LERVPLVMNMMYGMCLSPSLWMESASNMQLRVSQQTLEATTTHECTERKAVS
jgi:hypothetical protein